MRRRSLSVDNKSFNKSIISFDNEDKTLIGLFTQKNRTGIAIYEEEKDQIIVSSVVEVETNDFQNLFKFLIGYPSTKYIIPQRCSNEFLENLKLICKFNKANSNNEATENEDSFIIEEFQEENVDNFESCYHCMNRADLEYEYVIDCLLNADYETVLDSENLITGSDLKTTFDKTTKMMYLRGVLDLENVPMISALGGLLNFLFQTSRIKRDFNIEKIKMKQPQKNVYINMNTYRSLSIIKDEIHPSQIKGKGRSKEGFSILNLYDSMISTTHGRKLLKNWFLNPTYEIDILEERLYTVSFFLSSLSSVEFEKIKKHMKKIYDVMRMVKRCKSETATKENWRKLEDTIDNFLQLKIIFQSVIEEYSKESEKQLPNIISKILMFDESAITELQKLIVSAFKFSDTSDRIEINEGIYEELDGLKILYENLDEVLTFYAQKELENLPDLKDQKLSLTYMPHFGYLVSIPKTESQEPQEPTLDNDLEPSDQRIFPTLNFNSQSNPGIIEKIRIEDHSQKLTQINEISSEEEEEESHEIIYQGEEDVKFPSQAFLVENQNMIVGDDWIFQFETKEFFYFKSDLTSQLDDEYGDVGSEIVDLEQELIRAMTEEVLKRSKNLLEMNDLIAEFDCFFCYSQIAKTFCFVEPLLTSESHFMIKAGRHILSEISTEKSYIPNDFFVYNYLDDFDLDFETSIDHPINKNFSNKFILLSGPNFSGKSIYLKQIGLIVFLCHIGSFVPASMCKIGLVDSIFSCINLTESLTEEECGFSAELQNLAKIFRLASNRSLVLLDEFGKNAPFPVGLASCISLTKYLTGDHFTINTSLTPNLCKPKEDDPMIDFKMLYERIPTTVFVTHHKEIFQNDLISENYLIRFFTMEAVVKNGDNYYSFLKDPNTMNFNYPHHKYLSMKEGLKMSQIEDQDKVIYNYKAKPGFSVNSFAVFCAKQIGFGMGLLKRINEIQNCSQEELPLNSLILDKEEDTARDLFCRINDLLCSQNDSTDINNFEIDL